MPRVTGTELTPGLFRPVLTITVAIGAAVLDGPAIVDSGADRTIIPAEIVELAGIVFTDLPLTSEQGIGAGGGFETRTCKGKVKWRSWLICSEFLVADHLPFALLGREDFFKRFNVRFGWHRDPPTVDIDPV